MADMELTIGDRMWTIDLDDRIGRGGFGRVYAASTGNEVGVVKLVPKVAGAQRELLIADDLSGVSNIVPVLGVGETDDSWAIAMPRAEQSLRDLLIAADSTLEMANALPILLDVAEALVSIEENGVVHRDLKPDNVLLLNGRWRLTDFGLARYAEVTTAADTWKNAKTYEYAAPEQWLGERATPATDVYAFGVMAFEILSGTRPFNGPDLRRQHLEHRPPALPDSVNTQIRNIVSECLIKAPQARPAPRRLVARLNSVAAERNPDTGAAALIEAQRREVARISEKARADSVARIEEDRRAKLFIAAKETFLVAEERLASHIHEYAPRASSDWPMKLGEASLAIEAPRKSPLDQSLPIDVIAHSEISVDQSTARTGGSYAGRSHSLWYCDAKEEGRYAWHETAFMRNPLLPDRGRSFNAARLFAPSSAQPNSEVAFQALSPGIGTYQLAWPFTPLLDDDLDDFVERWSAWFAQASDGALGMPGTMPERPPHGSWRGGS
jgi:eukaryotic-like serine/threonine-protein kinase